MAFWKCVAKPKPKPCEPPKKDCKPTDCKPPKCEVKYDCGYKSDYGCEVKIPCHPGLDTPA